MKRSTVAAVSIAFLSLSLALPAQAQSIQIGPGGVTVNPDRGHDRRDRFDRQRVSSREATRIARSNGVDRVNAVSERRGNWVVTGTDRRGRGLIVTIDSRTGGIINVDRERGRW